MNKTDAAHVLPVLFAFTTPGKFCYRAIATFSKHVTGMSVDNALSPALSMQSTFSSSPDLNNGLQGQESLMARVFFSQKRTSTFVNQSPSPPLPQSPTPQSPTPNATSSRIASVKRSLTLRFSSLGNSQNNSSSLDSSNGIMEAESDIQHTSETPPEARTAGQGIVYSETPVSINTHHNHK
jgi:hypothetical protein